MKNGRSSATVLLGKVIPKRVEILGPWILDLPAHETREPHVIQSSVPSYLSAVHRFKPCNRFVLCHLN
jgi:hypothetical protein